MNGTILLTSFQTWLPHQKSNSSDDLLIEIDRETFSVALAFLRHLPVDIPQATREAIAKIEELQPDGIICCGMAESRTNLMVESCATCGDALIKTWVDLDNLVAGSVGTTISDDAGKFVCEGLYYEVLKYLQERNSNTPCLFVHVPILTPDNLPDIVTDFRLIIEKIASFAKVCEQGSRE